MVLRVTDVSGMQCGLFRLITSLSGNISITKLLSGAAFKSLLGATKMRTFYVLACAAICCLTSQVFAAGDISSGKQKSAVCAACHGMDGNSLNPEWPKLAG